MSLSKVVIIQDKQTFSGKELDSHRLKQMFLKGLSLLMGEIKIGNALRLLFRSTERIGIKINTIGGKFLSTAPETALSLVHILSHDSDFPKQRIIVWDRTNRELKEAGYRFNTSRNNTKIFGTDTQGVGYDNRLVSYRSIGSLYSSIQSRMITASISLSVLKDHGLAGITGSMKNYFGAIHNPNKYHDNHCDPFVADLFDSPWIKQKHRLSILDAIRVQYHRGPSYHSRWAEDCGMLIFSQDPVAADTVGWDLIERLRSKKGLPTLKEENREPVNLKTAESLGLGNATLNNITILHEEL